MRWLDCEPDRVNVDPEAGHYDTAAREAGQVAEDRLNASIRACISRGELIK